ncbi:DUF4440 domain-containing protein [Nocardiopsis sp. RSe5-2]|uniref:DUF4440 domain-containing protein n=1 Tax=Nocardiopsis endophytica TaxID=3018445 RepID=A0ABT4TYR5_9ACTN|nr:DUF4440 domain-containing protein [Nocardiopsis endophytica]MDA2809829.1 DUF4440 domain-containing protein [Nocardiopsis endophytica]
MHAAVEEITELHRHIEAWLRGEADPGTLADFLGMLTPGFRLHAPGGDVVDASDLEKGFPSAHGSAPGLVLTIREPFVVAEGGGGDGGVVVAAYEEHQESPKERSVRRCTVVFVRDASARHGLRWHHLHETWIVAPEDGDAPPPGAGGLRTRAAGGCGAERAMVSR